MQPNENRPHYQLQPEALFLYRRWVQHDANRSTEGLGGERGGELGADDAGVAWYRALASVRELKKSKWIYRVAG